MDGELTLEILDGLIEQTKEEIIGFVVHPDDARSLKDGSKALCGVDDYKMFVCPPYTGIPIYISELIPKGQPLKLTKRNTLQLKVKSH